MNKQKAVEILKNADTLTIQDTRTSNLVDMVIKSNVIATVELIDEPQKPLVQQFVADWYEERKDDLETALFRCVDIIPRVYEDGELNQFQKWFISGENKPFQTLVNMNQFGYTVEKEPKYTVKIKGKIGENLLVYGWGIKRYFFARTYNDSSKRGEHTRKELEEDGFGWVFDCPGIEIEEVTE